MPIHGKNDINVFFLKKHYYLALKAQISKNKLATMLSPSTGYNLESILPNLVQEFLRLVGFF